MSTPEENKGLARRWFEEVWNQRRTATIYELLRPDSVGHTEHGDKVGPEAFAEVQAAFLAAFPDLQLTVEATVAEGDDVVVRWSASGTHRGEFAGLAPTGRPVRFRGLTWMRFQGGRPVEGWDSWNVGGLVQQLAGA